MQVLRRYALSIVIVLLCVTLSLTVLALSRVLSLNAALSANVNAQVANRAANVRTWCGAINQGRNYDRSFVAHVTRGRVRYGLADLNCSAIVGKTLKSAHHK